jgi:WD40 repeat protein
VRIFTHLLLSITAAAFLRAQPDSAKQESTDGVPAVSIGHVGVIRDLFTSPDGTLALTFDGAELHAWDVATGKEIKTLGTYSTWYRGGTAHFLPDRGWLVFCSGRTDIYDLKTLNRVKEFGRHVDTTVFDQHAPNGLWAAAQGDHIDFGQIVDLGLPNVVLVIKSKKVESDEPRCRRLFSIGPRRVLADTNYGPFIIDLETWSVSSPGHTPKAGKRTSVHRQEHVNEYTFTCDPVEGWCAAGPDHTVLQFKSAPDQPVESVAILAPSDLRELRSTKLATPGRFLGFGLLNERETALWFASDKGFSSLTFATLAPGATFEPQFGFPVPFAKAAAIKGRDEVLVAYANALHKVDTRTGKSIAEFGGRVATPAVLEAHPTRLEFVVTHGEKGKRVRFTPAGLQVTTIAKEWPRFVYRPTDGQLMIAGDVERREAAATAFWPGKKGDVVHRPVQLVFSPDGTIVAGQNSSGVTAYKVSSGERILDVKWDQKSAHSSVADRTLAISRDNAWLIVSDGAEKMAGFDLQNGELAWEQAVDRARTLCYFPNNKVFCVLTGDGPQIRAVDSGTLKLVGDRATASIFCRAAAISRDGRYIVSMANTFAVYDTEKEEVVFELPIRGRAWSVAFLSNPRYVVSTGSDKLIHLWDLQEKKELCGMALFSDTDDWTITTPQLRFDGTEEGLREMYVVRDATVLPLESLFDKLYTPKLLPSLLAGEKLDLPIIDFKKLSAPPLVHLELTDGQRNLQVEDDAADHQTENESVRLRAVADGHGAPVQEIRFYQNGKLIATRAPATASASETIEVKLGPGENVFKAVAVNAERTESVPHALSIDFKPSRSKPAPAGGLRLHLLVVGLNRYKNPKYNLNYAVADASAVKTRIEEKTTGIFTGSNTKVIFDSDANKTAITSALREMAAAAGPRDVFMFYYAGHGVMTSEATPEFYLVPHDVTQLYGADDELRSRGISAKELQELSKTMPAQKQLFILDACQSAGALKSVAMRGAAEEKAIAQLARSTGTHWLTASGSEQFATEFEQLGHGAFTYVLLEGLAGKADTGDSRVTVNELKAYLESQVPEVTQKHKGTPQFPSSYGFGQDFPLTVIK